MYTSTVPSSSITALAKSTVATTSPLFVMLIIPLFTALPVAISVTFTRTVTLPALVLVIEALTLTLRGVIMMSCVVMFSLYVVLPL